MWRRLLGEPLLHFLVLGSVLFAIYGWREPNRGSSHQIVVTGGVVDDLAAQHQARWGRPPTSAELNGLVESYVREEILYREGVRLGLDRDDLIVKRRVRQKLEVMVEEELSAATPTDADLATYLAENSARFIKPGAITFEQVFLGSNPSGTSVSLAVARTREAAARGADPATLGQSTMLPHKMAQTPVDLIAREFGGPFATALEKLPIGEWVGPVDSTYGKHAVCVLDRTPSLLPSLAEARTVVQREWEYARRQRANEDSYRKLRAQYDVTIEAKAPGGRP